MEYRIEISDIENSAVEKTLFVFRLASWSKRINSHGKMVFFIDKHDQTIDLETDLQIKKRVNLLRRDRSGSNDFEKVWHGYIDAYQDDDPEEMGIACNGMLALFEDRLTAASDQLNGQGSTEAEGLLTAANASDDTGVTVGTDGDVTGTKDITVDETTIASAWEALAQAHDAEFEINDDGEFNFVDLLGTNKTAEVNLQFRRDGTPGNNIVSYDEGQDGEPMVTRILARTSGGGGFSVTRNSSGAVQAKYGVLERRIQFYEANDLASLTQMADSLLSQLEQPATATQIQPVMASKKTDITSGRSLSGFDYNDFILGDLRTIDILTEQTTLDSVTRRIVEIEVRVDDNGMEELFLTLTEAGIFITADLLDAETVRKNKRRINKLETLL